jgi:hypothetical protein
VVLISCSTIEKYNFTYDDGDAPWENHIPSEINTTYEIALKKMTYLRTLECSGDSTDFGKHPFGPGKPICLEGHGAKMVIPRNYPHDDYFVLTSPENGGLFEKEHKARRAQLQYYGDGRGTYAKYFLIPFDGHEIPTCFPKETLKYLPLWKSTFLKRNRMSEEYYKKHIRVVSTTIELSKWKDKPDSRFTVHYYYYVGWARIKLRDAICVNENYEKTEELISMIMSSDDIYYPGLWFMRDELGIGLSISRVALTAGIASKEEIKQVVLNASPKLTVDVNTHLRLNHEGEFVLRVYGVENELKNICLKATVTLEDAGITEVSNIAYQI